MALTIWRRHTEDCPHRSKGRTYLKCNCPVWADGYQDGKRTLRQSLETRDLARARKKATSLEAPEIVSFKSVDEAVTAFLEHCQSDGLRFSTFRKYRNTLSQLQLLRQFCGFCQDRKWSSENVAKRIKPPRNIQPNDVEPFSLLEVSKIIEASGQIGRTPYERLRAKAMILMLRFTALRIGDVAMLAKDRISRDGKRWRVFLRTEKSGKPVFLPIPHEMKLALDVLPAPRGGDGDFKHFFWNGTTSERAMKGISERTLAAVFKKSGVSHAHAHRFRHTLATELLGRGASFEDVADILGNSLNIVRKHYAKWSPARQARIDELMEKVHAGTDYLAVETAVVQ